MTRAYLGFVVCVTLALACGDDSDMPNGAAGSGGEACPDFSGTWTISNHCNTALIGMPVTVTQTGCNVVTGGSFPGFTGTVQPDGTFGVSGTANGLPFSCTGMGSMRILTQSCTGNCNVTLTR